MNATVWRKPNRVLQIKGYSKQEVLRRLDRLGDEYDILHPMKSSFNTALGLTVYYISVKRKA